MASTAIFILAKKREMYSKKPLLQLKQDLDSDWDTEEINVDFLIPAVETRRQN
jgi:hypothetical protein